MANKDLNQKSFCFNRFVRGDNDDIIKMNTGYIDREKICCQFSLLLWTSFKGQFVHPVGVKGKW